MYLVVDTWVWEKAQEGDFYSLELLAKICRKCEHKIIYDYEREILDEYEKHIEEDPSNAVHRIFKYMTQTGKIVPKSRSTVKIENFDKSDMKFIQVAIPSSALVISGDSDFLEIRKHLINKKLNVKILTPMEALDRL
jgi:predicted nucleic acid-binding protein